MRNIFAFNQFYLIDCEVYKKIDLYICITFFCKKWTAQAPITIQRSIIFFLFFVQRWHRTDKALYIWTAHASISIRYYYTRSRKSKWPEVFAKCQVRWTIITAILTFSDWIQVYAEKLVNSPQSHKIEYAPIHTIRVITRLA